MRPADPPGFYCHGCGRLIDANDSAHVARDRHWCSRRCDELDRLGEAQQLVIGGAK